MVLMFDFKCILLLTVYYVLQIVYSIQGCKSLLSIGGDNLQFCPIFNIRGDEPQPPFFSGELIK